MFQLRRRGLMEPFRTGLFRFVLWGSVMFQHRVRRAVCATSVALSFLFLFAIVAFAAEDQEPAGLQAEARFGLYDRRQNAPGEFDFYLLALSWSPSYCEAARERGTGRKPDVQCGGRPFAFVVHGLWPQYEHGFPSYCQVPVPRLGHDIIGRAMEIMPSPGLVIHEWGRHGTCSGMSPGAFFETVRKARTAVKIPPEYLDLATPISVDPNDVAAAFAKINPGLSREDMAIGCDKRRLTEVRLCLAKDFSFHACPEVARRSCKRNKVEMPAIRGAAVSQ
jgi:ribonuclease T2